MNVSAFIQFLQILEISVKPTFFFIITIFAIQI